MSTTQVMGVGGPPGALSDFVARVPGIEGVGQCREYDVSRDGAVATLINYTIGSDTLKRGLSLEVDAKTGQRRRFSEMRGELNINSTAPSTTITLDFIRGTASASNESPNGIEVARGSLAEALDAPNLGMPRRMLDLIEQRCMRKATTVAP